jgi:hypothetical protein
MDLTTGTPVALARARLQAFLNSPRSSEPAASYYRALLTALDGKADSDVLGTSLDGVPCGL